MKPKQDYSVSPGHSIFDKIFVRKLVGDLESHGM